jgi:hypothetical protein
MKGETDKKKGQIHDIQEPQKCLYIFNRRTGRFEIDSANSDNAMEFKFADYAIKHTLGDFEDNSCIWFENKVAGTAFLMVCSLLLSCLGVHYLDCIQWILGGIGVILGLTLHF